VNQKSDSTLGCVFKLVGLGHSLFELAIECSFKDGRVIAGDLLVEAEGLFSLVFACIKLDDGFGIPVTR
jgi:hypothetical protein